MSGRRRGCDLAMLQKRCNFSALRGSEGAAEPGAFQGRRGGGEAKRSRDVLVLGDRERESAMEDVAGPQRIDRVHREGRRLLQLALLIEPQRALRSAGTCEKGGR